MMQPVIVPPDWIYADALVVFPTDAYDDFGFLASGFHWLWATTQAGTMGGTRVRYSPSQCFETLVPPPRTDRVRTAAEQLDTTRNTTMAERNVGLTELYNLIHGGINEPDIDELRRLHVDLDTAIGDAYGWTDLDLRHDFYETRQGVRYTFEPMVRQEILDRLLELNHERYAAEVTAGMHAKKKANTRRPRARAAPAAQTTMLGDG